ncbi:MAG: thiolase family protein [Terriglobales bacterium]
MQSNDDVVVVSAVRTPFSKFGGALKDMHSIDLGVVVIRESLKAVGLTGAEVDEMYYGMCIQSEAALESNVNGRQALLRAGLPPTVLSMTLDRACCSSLTCVQLSFRSIRAGNADVCLAVGVENMSNTPLVMNGIRWGRGLQPPVIRDHLNPISYTGFNAIAKDAGDSAVEHGVTRDMQDRWALRSQQRYQEAAKQGKFKDEVVPVCIPQHKRPPVVFDTDEFPKPDTTLEVLAKLPTIYGSSSVTAGNAPGLDAGASAVLLMRRAKAEELGLKPLATVLAAESVAVAPEKIAEAPAPAIQKALAKAAVRLDQIDVIEINEAFAAVPLVSTKILASGDERTWRALLEKTNVNGGAIAVGHPVGASGARILMTMMYELRRRGGGFGACAICGGLGQGDAAVIRVEA